MNAEAEKAEEQVANVVEQLKVADDVLERLEEGAAVAHVADEEDGLVDEIDGADEPERGLQPQ